MADVFVNPTREDTFPTVNIESLACGTPGVTFKTGGCPEVVTEEVGAIVECGDVNAMEECIYRVCNDDLYSAHKCIERANKFEKYSKFDEYIKLYKSLV